MYTNDVCASRVIAKPYMYLYREGIFSMKHRLDARQSMSLNEYMDAILALLADQRAYDVADYADIMHHLRKVVRDAMERPWHAVRRWTQYIWDSIESGLMTWSNRDMIQEERARLCLTGLASNMPHSNSTDTNKTSGATQVIYVDSTTQGWAVSTGNLMGTQVYGKSTVVLIVTP